MLTLATWNVNSVKARVEKLADWAKRRSPDIVCLQELKVEEPAFPAAEIHAMGFDFAGTYQKTYNGVGILSRYPLTDVSIGMADGSDDTQARLVAATIAGVRVISAYFPNGERIGSEKYDYKLEWMTRLRAHLDAKYRNDQPLVLCGDFNVAVDDRDVYNPRIWNGTPLFHPDVRERLSRIRAFGFEDILRKHHEEAGIFSWWDYRWDGLAKGEGLRIDHVWATPSLAATSIDCVVDRDERKGKGTSDHAPVVATFDWPVPGEPVKVPGASAPPKLSGQGSLF